MEKSSVLRTVDPIEQRGYAEAVVRHRQKISETNRQVLPADLARSWRRLDRQAESQVDIQRKLMLTGRVCPFPKNIGGNGRDPFGRTATG
jgi:hypothetical protein